MAPPGGVADEDGSDGVASRLGGAEADELRPEGAPERSGSLADDEDGAAAVDEDAGGDAQDAFLHPAKTPALTGGVLDKDASDVRDVVGERVEQENRLVVREGFARRGGSVDAVAAGRSTSCRTSTSSLAGSWCAR